MKKQWFKGMPWDRVLLINQNLCDKTPKEGDKVVTLHEVRESAGQQARKLWEQLASQELTLFEAIDLCRRCCDLAAFTFHNANTFSDVAKTILEDWLNLLPGVEAQIVRTTIGHYVADHVVSRKEMVKVIGHFDLRWRINGHAKAAPTPTPSPDIAAQPQPHIAQA
jgi:hypothetical protein